MFQGEVAEHVVSYQPGAKASSDFATFPVTSFVKVKAYRAYTHQQSFMFPIQCL